MALPTHVIELQFGASGWVDVTSVTNNVSINKGISRQLDDYSAGTLSITFTNNDRTFDPTNTSSILWYGAGGYSIVQPGGKVRVSANGIRRFTGFIQSWDFTYDQAGFDANATLSALDEMFRVSNAVFDESTEGVVEDTGNRIKDVLNFYGFGASEYSGIQQGITIVGADIHNAGDNVLTYIQNVARSEPADLFANASAVMVMKDRSFTDYVWSNSIRNNLISYPATATFDTTIVPYVGGTGLGNGWVLGGRSSTFYAPIFGGTVNRADVDSGTTRSFYYQEVNQSKINPSGTVSSYVYSVWLRGAGLTGAGVTGNLGLLDSSLNLLAASPGEFASTASSAVWVQMTGTATYSGTAQIAGFNLQISAPGTAITYDFYGNGWQVENAATYDGQYFDGQYNIYSSTSGTVYQTAWSGVPYASYSGLLKSIASTATSTTALTFADQNSQGAAYGNGTALPFMELALAYGGEQMYNSVQVVGVNATATAKDTALISTYGLRSWAQTDNLTTSLTKPQDLANSFLAEWRLPEYRAQEITIALESLSSSNQNKVLALELRDVVKVYFQLSAQGSVIGKFYQILGITSDTDNERSHITLKLSSLDRLPIRLDSNYLSILDTSTLG